MLSIVNLVHDRCGYKDEELNWQEHWFYVFFLNFILQIVLEPYHQTVEQCNRFPLIHQIDECCKIFQ